MVRKRAGLGPQGELTTPFGALLHEGAPPAQDACLGLEGIALAGGGDRGPHLAQLPGGLLEPPIGDRHIEGALAQIDPSDPRVIRFRTFSKAYGLAGARVGYGIAAPALIQAFNKVRNHFGMSRVSQAGALAAVRNRADYQPKIDLIVSERARVVQALAAAGWELYPTQANFVYLELGERTEEVYVALEKRGVVTRPFAGEGVRVTIGTPEENDRFLAALAEITG